jgi:hypothetical protein
MEIIKKIILTKALVAILLVFGGYVFMRLWFWYITPLSGIDLSLVQCIGIMLFLKFLQMKWDGKLNLFDEHSEDPTYQSIFNPFLVKAFMYANFLLMGYIFNLFQ